jgi:hypothetical protein
MKDTLYEELEHVFNKFPKYHTEIMLADFNAKVGREDVFKPTTGNDSLHEISNDNEVRVVSFATFKNLIAKVLRSHIVTFIEHLMRRRTTRFTIF